jgi:uncharacterized repeat protein (TIGR01451 family)
MKNPRYLIISLILVLSLAMVTVVLADTNKPAEEITVEDKSKQEAESVDPLANGVSAIPFPPPDWTVIDNGGTCVWESNFITERPNYAGGSGFNADADSDWCGSGTTMDTELWTPVLDLSASVTATLEYIAAYNDIGTGDIAEVLVSDDGGASWTSVLMWDEDHSAYGPGEVVMIDLTPYVGSANVMVSFHYYAPGWDWWYQIDDVYVHDDAGTVLYEEFEFSLPPDLGASSKQAPYLVDWGDPIHYTIEIVNTGELPALSTVLTDVIPYGTEYVADSLVCSAGDCWFDEIANTVYWTGTVDAPSVPLIQPFVEPAIPPVSFSATPATNLLQFGESNVSGNPVTPAGSIMADILLDQPPNQSNGIFADASCDLCGGAQVLAENFVLGSSVNVGQIVFWTGYFPTDTPIDPDEITVIFHEDAGGLPGAALYTESNIAYDRVQTGVILFGVQEWMHTLTLATPVALGPGTYWVEIYNDTGFGTDDMFWEVGDLDPANGIAGQAFAFEAPGSSWFYDPEADMAIQLIGAEPVIVEFDVQPLACGITVENEAVVYDPELIGGPVYLYASTDVLTTDPVYEEDFEADDGDFTISGVITNTWAWGDPTSGPFDAHSGVNLWATNLSGSYMNDEDGYITSPLIDLSAYAGVSFILNWWQWYSGENCCDYISVEVTNDGGATWDVVYGPYHGGQVTELEWVPILVDLNDSYAVSDFQMRFHFTSDGSVVYEGWYVDDINLLAVTPCAPPDILVDAPPLHAYVVPTSTQTIPFDVCNLGESVLDWSVKELSPTMTAVSFPNNLINSPPASSVEPEIMRLPDGSVDCAAYENYIFAEPKEVAEACYAYSADKETQSNGVLAPTDLGFAHDIGFVSDNVVDFTLNDFPGQTVLSSNIESIFGYDYDVSATILYALHSGANQLGTFDKYTGVFTPIGPSVPSAGNWTGIAVDPSSDVIYASSTVCGTESYLHTLDPATGTATAIGPMGIPCVISIAMSLTGEMYAHDIVNDAIYQVDPATGVGTLVGATGYAANFAQGMDFDNDDGTLYIFLYIGGGANVFGTVDLTTGAVTPLATDNPLGEFEGAIQIPGFVFDIPWLSEAPTAGSVLPSFCDMVDVTFDSTGMALGEYYGDLGVNSNDPDTPVITLPVTMTVAIPAIELEKTVGLDPAVCADTDSIQVLAGAEVAYCYSVTNIGDVTLPLHDLVDSELGILLEDVPYDLDPGMSFELIVTATVDVDTTNEATWTAFVHEGFSAEASDSATVDVLWPEIELNKTVGLDPNACATTDSISVPVGTEVTYCFEVVNTGEETLVLHDLVDSELGALLEDFVYDLAPGASVFITETVAVTEDTVNTATWTAYMDENFFAEASDTATVTVYTPWIYLPLITRDSLP